MFVENTEYLMQNYNAKKAIVVSAMRDDNFNTTSKLEEI
jgi:hypothetical protein